MLSVFFYLCDHKTKRLPRGGYALIYCYVGYDKMCHLVCGALWEEQSSLFSWLFYILWFLLLFAIQRLIYYYYALRVFPTSVSWWFSPGVWVTASLLKSPGLVSGFWPFLAVLSFRYSLPVRQLPSLPGLLIILTHQSQLAQSLLSSSTAFIICSLRVFHISFSWWSFTGVWVTASLLKSPGLFSVF